MRSPIPTTLLLLVATAAGAHALLAPEYYRKARVEAPYHVQVAIARVVPPASGAGACVVEGTIAKIFRDAPSKLTHGMSISFPVACHLPGEMVPIGGTIWTDTEVLLHAKYIEVYLVADGAGYETALWQSKIIGAPSANPQLPVD